MIDFLANMDKIVYNIGLCLLALIIDLNVNGVSLMIFGRYSLYIFK